ncbi:MAG: lantibiotic dehydratase [Knoellia sp.]
MHPSDGTDTAGMRLVCGRGWSFVSPVIVRTTGLPSELLSSIGVPGLSGRLDAWESGDVTEAELAQEYAEAVRGSVGAMLAHSEHPLFREALAWQNPATLATFASLARQGATGSRNARRRDREHRLVRYLTRYAGKTETIGFFGPMCHGSFRDGRGHVEQRPGPGLVGLRQVFAEPWAVRALGRRLAEDDQIAQWLPLRPKAHHRARAAETTETDPVGAAVTAACREGGTLREVVARVSDELDLPQARISEAAVRLRRSGVLVVDADLPFTPDALDVLVDRVASIDDPVVRRRADDVVGPFLHRLTSVTAAAGDADRVASAHVEAADCLSASAGVDPQRRSGQMYAGRSVLFEECVRDLEVDFGSEFADRLDPALRSVVAIGRWLTQECARAYLAHCRTLWPEGTLSLGAEWFALLRAFHGSGPRPVDAVIADMVRRWDAVVETLPLVDGIRRSDDAADFADSIATAFAASGPGWSSGRIHSPDIQLCEHVPGGVSTGRYDIVLSEVHFAAATGVGPVFEWSLDDAPLSRLLSEVVGPSFVPLYPEGWPRHTGRTLVKEIGPGDRALAFTDVQGAPAGTVAVDDIAVEVDGDRLWAVLPDGTRTPLEELLGVLMGNVVLDAWKHLWRGEHTPRLVVGDVVMGRETWRTELPVIDAVGSVGEHGVHAAVHRWRRSLGLPDKVFVSLAGEAKPFYLDFDSPPMVLAFAGSVRNGARDGASATVAVSEALPEPHQAWVRDVEGRGHHGEIRMMLIDPETRVPGQEVP